MPVSTPNGYLDFTNATPRATKVIATSNVGIGTSAPGFSLDVHGDSNTGAVTSTTINVTDTTASTSKTSGSLTVAGGLGVSGNIYADLPVATIASNLVTYDKTTGLLKDSGGLFSNKLAVVSEQPPAALTSASTTITDHGVYKVTASVGSATAPNVFNKTGTSWTGSADYTGTNSVYAGSTRLASSIPQGDWIVLELPYKATLRHLTVTDGPLKANLFATNDNITWTELTNWSSVSGTVIVNATATYKKYAVVATQLSSGATLTFGELRLFTESFAIDGGKVAMASSAITGGNTVVDQTGPHARGPVPLRKYPEVNMQDYRQGGYTASASSDQNIDRVAAGYAPLVERSAWAAFNGSETDGFWQAYYPAAPYDGTEPYDANTNSPTITDVDNVEHRGHWIKLELPHKIKVQKMTTNHGDQPERYDSVILLGSNDDTNWYVIKDTFTLPVTSFTSTEINSNIAYKYVLLLIKSLGTSDNNVDLYQLQYYGYEETSDPDTSVDTTITSQFNLPDTTGVKLYIDGDKGSTATDFSGEGHTLTENNATYDSTEKAWEFSSLSTSNVTMSTGDLAMEGTHPHSVSLWFNAANVSSNATLFHVGTAAGEGDAKTTIPLTETGHLGWIDGGDNQFLSANTWHNLVYATQGGGGVRTCYLDGRKLGDVSVQDTFGEYPPFAMTGYSQGGYVASFSRAHDSVPWHMWGYDETSGADEYGWTTPFVNGGGGVSSFEVASGNVRDGGSGIPNLTGTYQGEYAKLELPYKLVLSSIMIRARAGQSVMAPRDFKVFGSNDDVNWVEILSETGATPSESADTSFYSADVQDRGYKYLALVINKIQPNNSHGQLSLRTLKLYGHKDNDTTRFPVSSTVLKYPHVAMTGQPGTSQSVSDLQHAQRGYEVTASSMYVGNASNPYQPWRMFDDIGSSSWWASTGQANTYGGGSGAYGTVRSANLGSDSGGSATPENGEWVKIKLQHAIVLSHIVMVGTTDTSALPKSFKLYGSNNGTSWTEILAVTGASSLNTSTGTTFTPSSTPSAYKHFGLVITQTQGRTNYTVVGELKLYGTEEDLDVIARVGEGLDGKVANFRVYDKYLHEEQALELWDAQKDQFGRAESSVVVHKGRLGVGTTEPEGRFAVLDEPNTFESRWPPKPLVGYNTHIEGYGEFVVHRSGNESTGQYRGNSWYIFDDNQNTHNYTYHGERDVNDPINGNYSYFKGTNGEYSGNKSIGGFSGDWTVLESPNPIKINDIIRMRVRSAGQSTTGFIIAAANEFDGGVWTKLTEQSNLVWQSGGVGESKTFHFENDTYYKYYAIIITQAPNQYGYPTLSNMEFSGIVQQGQSTLHDGSLTLTKNLTVPRIGPPLDADDTPRRDRLVVEYNTSTNPTANGTVKDTSRRGVDGLIRGSASYDATEKAFDIEASSDIITTGTNIGGVSGDFLASLSVWIKPGDVTSASSRVIFIHTSAYAVAASFALSMWEDEIVAGHGGTNNQYVNGVVNDINRWYHIVAIKKGTGTVSNDIYEIYINGVKQTLTTSAGTDVMNVGADQAIIVGSAREAGLNTEQFTGKISNLKYYPGTVLTADEAKRLYDMGRLGNVIAQPVHIAAPLQVEKTLRVPIDGTTPGTTGMVRFNTYLGKLQVHNGNNWVSVGSMSAAGGTVDNADGYTIHTFTSSGTFTVYSGGDVEYLVVAGGGGGGGGHGGAGGAGGLLTGTYYGLAAGVYTITLGPGGTGGAADIQGTNGTNSSAIGYTAYGGGGGGRGYAPGASADGSVGGSGGGGGPYSSGGAATTTTPSQGNAGGNGIGDSQNIAGHGGGGGGAGGTGGNALTNGAASAGISGKGGLHISSSISGTSVQYAGGGSGGRWGGNQTLDTTGGVGSTTGGGGIGGATGAQGMAAGIGVDGTGGGGGGGSDGGGSGGSGGDGIVIIRYLS